ncbi:MAG: extracellular solute-binding protein [Candidatus Nomurabacteria bacterium]|nr:extracellular solute-binding protein [Candidatus Nomurabacteria bacterium]
MKGNNFQLILLIIFIVGAVFGILVFAGLVPFGQPAKTGPVGTVVLWGTVKQSSLGRALADFGHISTNVNLKYVEKNPLTFDHDLLEALASGVGPDLFILPDDLILHYKDKIALIPYASYSEATFKNTFAGAGEIYLSSKGILALPLSVDPLIMYYNRTVLDANNITNPPAYWDDLQNIVPLVTKKDISGKIINSGVALGQFTNIEHAKDIISTLFMQAGSTIVQEKGGFLNSTLSALSNSANPGTILSFYTQFADPLSPFYSWNRSLPNSKDSFSANNLTFYFGFASELPYLTNKNPNLNFYITSIPQIKNSSLKVTFGKTQGIAVSTFSKNKASAFSVAGLLASGDFAKQFSDSLLVAPARRDLLAVKPTDAYFPIFYSSALYAKSWLDPSAVDTDSIFSGMVDNVLSNTLPAKEAVLDASAKLDLLLH